MATTRGRKVALGCLFGCAGTAALAVAAFVIFMIWLTRPGELLDADRLVSPDTSGYVAWTLSDEDEATRQFFFQMIDAMQQRPEDMPEGIPSGVRGLLAGMNRKSAQKDVEQMLPMTIAWTMRPGGDDKDLHLWTGSMEKLGKQMVLVDFFVGRFIRNDDFLKEKYRGERIYTILDDDDPDLRPSGFIRGNDLFLTSDLQMAREAVDLLATDVSDRGASALQQRLAQLPTTGLRGVIWNADGSIQRILTRLAGDDPDEERPTALEAPAIERWSDVEWMIVRGNFVDGQDFRVSLDFICPDAGCRAAGIPELVENLTADSRDWKVDVEIRSTETPEGLELTLTTHDLIDWLERARRDNFQDALGSFNDEDENILPPPPIPGDADEAPEATDR